ncbi:MAG: type II secretion system F family protein [Candidatus Woesearchaeota archaeon]
MKWLASRMPGLNHKLRTARMSDSPEYYLKKTVVSAAMLTFGIVLIAFFFTQSVASLLAVVLFPLFFLYFLHYVDIRIIQLAKALNQELTYAGRFLVIEIEAGVALHKTFQNLAKNYPEVGKYFQEIVDKVGLGTSMDRALNELIEYAPSDALRKLLWQILNSLRTGSAIADSLRTGSAIADSLRVAIDQITRQQQIEVVEYGRKLNPLAMFYMMIAVILPSLGAIMVIVMATFIGFQISLAALLIAAGLLLFMQFMFLATIKSQRPSVSY